MLTIVKHEITATIEKKYNSPRDPLSYVGKIKITSILCFASSDEDLSTDSKRQVLFRFDCGSVSF